MSDLDPEHVATAMRRRSPLSPDGVASYVRSSRPAAALAACSAVSGMRIRKLPAVRRTARSVLRASPQMTSATSLAIASRARPVASRVSSAEPPTPGDRTERDGRPRDGPRSSNRGAYRVRKAVGSEWLRARQRRRSARFGARREAVRCARMRSFRQPPGSRQRRRSGDTHRNDPLRGPMASRTPRGAVARRQDRALAESLRSPASGGSCRQAARSSNATSMSGLWRVIVSTSCPFHTVTT